MNKSWLLFTAITLLAIATFVLAAPAPGLHFMHGDWELACDNTRTCRAAGYQSDDDELAVSVLLTRAAGAKQAVTAELMLGSLDQDEWLDGLPDNIRLSMQINATVLGDVVVSKSSLMASLEETQVAALLAALPHSSRIEWSDGVHRWHLSDKGAAAALLKMDEFQGRLKTVGALIRKGTQSEDRALAPLPLPIIKVAKVSTGVVDWAGKKPSELRALLRANVAAEDCPDLQLPDAQDVELTLLPLDARHMLASARCWAAAYNTGYGYWVISKETWQVQLVTTFASEYSAGQISAAQKGRGLGDCWSSDGWSWDGQVFVHSESSTSGLCKGLAAGGAWTLPTLVSEIRKD